MTHIEKFNRTASGKNKLLSSLQSSKFHSEQCFDDAVNIAGLTFSQL